MDNDKQTESNTDPIETAGSFPLQSGVIAETNCVAERLSRQTGDLVEPKIDELTACPVEHGVRWEIGTPPADVLLDVRGSNCTGDWYAVGMRKDYKKPPKGKSKKGFKRGWRWLDEEGKTFEDKPEAWRTRPT